MPDHRRQRAGGGHADGVRLGTGERVPGDRDAALRCGRQRRPGLSEAADAALSSVLREEWPRLIGAALRIVGDLQTAEDVVQETLLTALDRWPLQGVPDRPGAWLMTACRNRARNVIRDTRRGRQRISSASYAANNQEPADARPGVIADDRLRLITLCCHPLLPLDRQVALTLRIVGGVAPDEIDRGFHLPAATIA